jgi:hypothetical protein
MTDRPVDVLRVLAVALDPAERAKLTKSELVALGRDLRRILDASRPDSGSHFSFDDAPADGV